MNKYDIRKNWGYYRPRFKKDLKVEIVKVEHEIIDDIIFYHLFYRTRYNGKGHLVTTDSNHFDTMLLLFKGE